MERLEIREQTKSKSEAKWKYKVRCVCGGVHVCVLVVCTLMLVNVYFQRGLCSGEAVCGVCVSLCYEQRYIPVWLCVCGYVYACRACASVCPPVCPQ